MRKRRTFYNDVLRFFCVLSFLMIFTLHLQFVVLLAQGRKLGDLY